MSRNLWMCFYHGLGRRRERKLAKEVPTLLRLLHFPKPAECQRYRCFSSSSSSSSLKAVPNASSSSNSMTSAFFCSPFSPRRRGGITPPHVSFFSPLSHFSTRGGGGGDGAAAGAVAGNAFLLSRRFTSSSAPGTPSNSSSSSSFFSRLSFLFRRIPTVPGFSAPPSTIRWATFTFWHLLHPVLYFHSMYYYPAKVKLDRLLEQQYFGVNLLLGVLFGLTLYFSVLHHLFPTTLPGEYYSLKEDADEVMRLMGFQRSSSTFALQGSWAGGKSDGASGGGGALGMGGGGLAMTSEELPAFLLMKAKGEVLGKLYVMVDAAEIHRQQLAVAELLEEKKKNGRGEGIKEKTH